MALVPRTDTVRCIEARARSLQGWRDETWIERLRVQRYHVGGHYGHHFDCESNPEFFLSLIPSRFTVYFCIWCRIPS